MQILVLRALGLGDLLTAVPAFRALRRAFPHAQVMLAAPSWQEPLAQLAGIDLVTETSACDAVRAPSGRIDLAVNLHGRGPQSTAALRALQPSALIAFGRRVRWEPEEHEVVRWCRLLGAHGIQADPSDLHLSVPPAGIPMGADSVVIHPGAATTGRRWPEARFAAVTRTLLERGDQVILTGSSAEVALCTSIAAAAGGGVVLAGRTSVMELASVVASATAVLTNDTGVAHLASALSRPSVVLFGPEPPSRWGPPAGPHIALWKGLRGDPRSSRLDPGLAQIHEPEVLDALTAVRSPTRLG
jgi:ADP-heptose:LPS heptosyltransferase